MAKIDEALATLAAERGLEPVGAVEAGPLTPLLVESKHCRIEPAVRGDLGAGGQGIHGPVPGVAGHLEYQRNKKFRFNVALTEIPDSTEFAPRVFCVRTGRSTRDDEFYGFEARHSKLWTESAKLNERYTVSTSPFQDPTWLRRLFSPAFVDWLAETPPADFSFELAYGALLGSVEEDHPDAAGLGALCNATAYVAQRIRSECEESSR